MSPDQMKLWRFIASHIAETGGSPLFEQMRVAMSWPSLSRVHHQLGRLESMGIIERTARVKGGITLLKAPPPKLALGAEQTLMWAIKTYRGGRAGVIQPLTLAFMEKDVGRGMNFGTARTEVVRVRVTIEEVKE